MLDEPFICDDAGLVKSVHGFADFDEGITVVDKIMELVLLHYTGWNGFNWDAHVLVAIHWRVEVEILARSERPSHNHEHAPQSK
jgi:hypothetical protein